jgi:AcrR family transcriptional regulator
MATSARPKAPLKAPRTARHRPRRGGRPTSAQAAKLTADLRGAALALFLEHGYDGTSLDAIARAAGTTKVSVYARFDDKESLFVSVVQWATGRADWPVPEPAAPDLDDLEGALRAIAEAAVRRATHPDMVKLTRIAVAEATRFPDLAEQVSAAGWPRKQLVADLLARHSVTGGIESDEPEILAEHFLALVSCVPARLASFGIVRRPAVQRRHTDVAVDLFLRGLRPR